MDAIETLMQEHRTIEQVLDALVGFAEEAVRTRRTDRVELSRFVTFLREFADARHHAKEEGVLFQTMAEHGFPTRGGPIAVMLHEHEQSRGLVGTLAALAVEEAGSACRRGEGEARAIDVGGPWGDEQLAALGEASRSYAALLRAHIHKEDAVLYPMAEHHVPPEALDEVGEACRRRDAADPATGERLLALADQLVAAHGPGAQLSRPA